MKVRFMRGLLLGVALAVTGPAFGASTSTDVIDSVSTSTAIKAPVRGVTTSNITLSSLSSISTVEGSMTPVDGDRFLLTGQTDSGENLIYVAHSTAWTVATDSDGARDLRDGTLVKTQGGVMYHLTTSDPISPGTTDLTWARIDALAVTGQVQAAATIAALKALTGLTDGQAVSVLCYYTCTTPDGGGGTFKWIAANTDTADNCITVAADAGGTGRWKRVYSGAVNVKWCGAKGDGSTNDTTLIDAAIVLAGEVYFPEGTYMVGSLAALPSSVTLYGEGRGKSILKQRAADTMMFTATDKTGITFRDLEFNGDDLGTAATAGGRASNTNKFGKFVRVQNVTLERVYIHDFTNQGIYFDTSTGSPQTRDIRLIDSEIANIGARNSSLGVPYSVSVPNAGAWLSFDVSTSGAQAVALASHIYIERSKIHGALNTLVSIANTDHYWIVDNEIYDTDSNTIQAGQRCRYGVVRGNHLHTFTGLFDPDTEGRGFSIGSNNSVETGFIVENNRIVDSANYGIDMLSSTDAIVRGNVLVDIAQTSNKSKAAIFTRGDRAIITGNQVYNPNAEGILRDDGDDGVIANNIVTSSDDVGIKANSATATQRRTKITGNNVYQAASFGYAISVEDATVSGNTAKDCNTAAAANIYGFTLFGADMSGIVEGNIASGSNHTYDINIAAAVVLPMLVRDNKLAGLGTGAFRDQGSASKPRNNAGFVTEASGTATIASGATTVVITHGLSVTPTADDITVNFAEQGTNDYGRWWISTITSTQFTINVSADPGASNLDLAWRAVAW